MKAIEKGMRPGICDTRAHIPHIVFADYKNKTSAEVVQVLDTQLEEVENADD